MVILLISPATHQPTHYITHPPNQTSLNLALIMTTLKSIVNFLWLADLITVKKTKSQTRQWLISVKKGLNKHFRLNLSLAPAWAELSSAQPQLVPTFCQAQPQPQTKLQLGTEMAIFSGNPATHPSKQVVSGYATASSSKAKLFALTSRHQKCVWSNSNISGGLR